MDPLSSLIDAPRGRGSFLLRVPMTRPWCIRVRDEAPLTVVAVTEGSAYFTREPDRALPLARGDLLLVRGPTPYDVGDAPGREPTAVIHPGNRSETPDGVSLDLPMSHGLRTWGNDPAGEDALLVGNYASVGEVGARMLDALPGSLVVRGDEWDSPLRRAAARPARARGTRPGESPGPAARRPRRVRRAALGDHCGRAPALAPSR